MLEALHSTIAPQNPRWRHRIHDGAKNSTTASHEPGWHANDPRSRLTNHVGGIAIHDGAAESTMAIKIARSRFTNPGGMQTIRVSVSRAAFVSIRSAAAAKNPRCRRPEPGGTIFFYDSATRATTAEKNRRCTNYFRAPKNLSIVLPECGAGAVSRGDRLCQAELTAKPEIRRSDSPRVFRPCVRVGTSQLERFEPEAHAVPSQRLHARPAPGYERRRISRPPHRRSNAILRQRCARGY